MPADMLALRELRRYPCAPMHDEVRKPPKKTEKARVPKEDVAVRLPPEVLAEVDAVAEELGTDWRRGSGSDALRLVIVKGLKAHKAEKAQHAPKSDPDPTK